MRAIPGIFFSLICLVGLSFTATAATGDYVNVSVGGRVIGAEGRTLRLIVYSAIPGEEPVEQSLRPKADGAFNFTLFIPEAAEAQLSYGARVLQLYLEPGYELDLTFTPSDHEAGLNIRGEGAEVNSYTIEFARRFGLSSSARQVKLRRMKPEEYRAWADGWKEQQLSFLQESAPTLPEAFVSVASDDINYSWANLLYQYASARQANRRTQLPESYFSFLEDVKLHNYDFIQLKSYREFLANYLDYQYRWAEQEEATDVTEEPVGYYNQMYRLSQQHLRALPKYHMQAYYLVKAITYLGVDQVVDEYIEFANECPKQAYKNVLHALVKSQTLEPKEPEIVFTDRQGRSIPLRELAGDIVLIRFETDTLRLAAKADEPAYDSLSELEGLRVLELRLSENQATFEKLIYADASTYLKSIMNRPKPGQEPRPLPQWGYVLLNREGYIVSNSLDDPENNFTLEKVKALLSQGVAEAVANN